MKIIVYSYVFFGKLILCLMNIKDNKQGVSFKKHMSASKLRNGKQMIGFKEKNL